MENIKMHSVEIAYVKESQYKLPPRESAEVSSQILVIYNGVVFAWQIGYTLFFIISREYENNDYNADLVIINILSGLGLLLSLLLAVGIRRRSTNMMVVWFPYSIATWGLPILVCFFTGDSYASFKIPTIMVSMILNYMIFIIIVVYFQELREKNSALKNTRQISVPAAAELLQPSLPLNFQNDLHMFNRSPYRVINIEELD